MSEADATAPRSNYTLAPATNIDDGRLIDFASRIWHDQPPYERILLSWWRRASRDCANVLIHEPTGKVVGLCAGRPSQWIVAGRRYPAVSICDFFTDPQHGGKLLGRRLLRSFEAPGRLVNAISISDIASAYVRRLGWMGPYASSLMAMPLPRLARMVCSALVGRADITLSDHSVCGGQLPERLKADLDRIELSKAKDVSARMLRDASEWSWHVSIYPERNYRFCIAHRDGEPVGYGVTRAMTPGRSRQMGRFQGALIVDLVAIRDDPQVLRVLAAQAVATAAELGAIIALFLTTSLAHRQALIGIGFVAESFPVLGNLLRRRAPVFMWPPRGPAAELDANTITMTFADSAVDLDL